jgi:hypothetical protein
VVLNSKRKGGGRKVLFGILGIGLKTQKEFQIFSKANSDAQYTNEWRNLGNIK